VYVNCGDWVDSCTAIVEHHDGRLELVHAWQPVAVASAPTIEPASGVGLACKELATKS
jgi:hypothetical protein